MADCYREYVPLIKAMSDETRLKIIDMLSCGELCACKILEAFSVTQPTLSYHLKILTESGIVIGRREGAWMHYSLNKSNINGTLFFLGKLTEPKKDDVSKIWKNAL